ncbi:MAG: proline--tRNA ligase, partial [Campylobacteraceae bacterium]|nr:proline--tRNA ligase [Campylobacteraceae bacterium]
NLICGSNEENYHMVGVSMFNFNSDRYADLVEVKEGDCCPNCGEKLKISKGIEVGHIFQLGQKYSSSMNATFLDQNGKTQPFFMGCYGIGVSRLIAVMIEANHDEKGCIWNDVVAPFQLDIIVSNIKDDEQNGFATTIYNELISEGFEVLLDDRNERFGFKINDFELLGFPYALVIGKGLQNGEVELIKRDTLEKRILHTKDVKSIIKEILS